MASAKERIWLEEYLRCWNATEAARRAGYAFPNKRGPEKKQKFAEVIAERLREKTLSADEVLSRLSEQARGDISDFIVTNVPGGVVDMEAVREKGSLIKSVQWTRQGLKIELYDAQSALVHIGRHYGLFKDRVEYSWRDEARREGVDPDAVYEQLIEEFTSAMVREGGVGGVEGSDAEGEGGAGA